MPSALQSKQHPLPSPLHLEGLWVSHSAFREGETDSQFVSQGIVPITSEAGSSYEALMLQLVAQEDGFVQFFVANETLGDVYFDDITGLVRRPKIIQEAHYNPFGLPLAGLTTLGNPEYAYFFTGKELYEDEALQWYDYGARMYDVQIGRWTTHDPLYQDASPYIFCGNNPIMRIDPNGMFWKEIGDFFSDVGKGIQQFGHYLDENQHWIKPVLAGAMIVGGVVVGATIGWTGVGGVVAYGMMSSGIGYFGQVANIMSTQVDDGQGGKRRVGWKEANRQAVFTVSINAPIGGGGTNQEDKKQLQKAKQQYRDRTGPSGPIPSPGYTGAGGANVDPVAYASLNNPEYIPNPEPTALYQFNGNPVYAGQDFEQKYYNKSFSQISTEAGFQSLMGIGKIGKGPDLRYIHNPNDNQVIDMRHFMLVGYENGMGFGLMVELGQGMGSLFNPDAGKSFFSPEDVYSNRLGVWFRNEMRIFNRAYENWAQNFGYWLSHGYSLYGSGN